MLAASADDSCRTRHARDVDPPIRLPTTTARVDPVHRGECQTVDATVSVDQELKFPPERQADETFIPEPTERPVRSRGVDGIDDFLVKLLIRQAVPNVLLPPRQPDAAVSLHLKRAPIEPRARASVREP